MFYIKPLVKRMWTSSPTVLVSMLLFMGERIWRTWKFQLRCWVYTVGSMYSSPFLSPSFFFPPFFPSVLPPFLSFLLSFEVNTFVYTISVHSYGYPIRCLSSFLKKIVRPERLSDLSAVTQLYMAQPGFEPTFSLFHSLYSFYPCFCCYCCCFLWQLL